VDAYTLANATLVRQDGVSQSRELHVEGGVFKDFAPKSAPRIDLGSSYAYPALINIHDHFRGNYLPRVGPRADSFYVNWSYWDNDLKTSDVYTERSNLSAEQAYFLSSYKNLFSGVATANDHFPHEINDQYIPRLPIRVIRDYALAHECSSFDLKWGKGIEVEYREASKRDWPFITHLEEGFDPESQSGIDILRKLGCLSDRTVMIHCIGFSDQDIEDTRRAGAHLAWCPASNMFMFNVTCKIRKFLKAGVNVSLGTDSAASGSINLLEEMKFARRTYRALYGEDLNPREIFKMVTSNPAKALRMSAKVGDVAPGMLADLLVLRPHSDDPFENLLCSGMEDIRLLVIGGAAVYGEERFSDLKSPALDYSEVSVGGRTMFVRGRPSELLKDVRAAVGFEKVLDFLPFGA
jgi:5-methylthioadenosine/S-adenosylhomocysteine deaminase